MADTPLEQRRFTDEEVREILKKAVERAPSRALVKREGLSLDELKEIGKEVGIDPDRLEDAARSVVAGGRARASRLVGAPTVLHVERKVEGTVDPGDTPEILSVIRRAMGVQGEASEIHGSLEWNAKGDVSERYVTLSSRDGVTTIQGSANLSSGAAVTYLPTGLIGFMISLIGLVRFAKTGSEVGLILFFAVLPILYPILRTIFRKVSDAESARLQQVVDDLARLTQRSGETE